ECFACFFALAATLASAFCARTDESYDALACLIESRCAFVKCTHTELKPSGALGLGGEAGTAGAGGVREGSARWVESGVLAECPAAAVSRAGEVGRASTTAPAAAGFGPVSALIGWPSREGVRVALVSPAEN